MSSPSSTPPHRTPSLTLVGQRTALWLFGSGALAVALVWASETLLGVIAPHDRIAYPALLAGFVAGALIAWLRPARVLLAQRLGVATLQAYVLVTAWVLLGGAHEHGPYAIATLAPWAIATELVLFAVWTPRVAFALALATTLLAPLPLLWVADPAAAWRGETGALMLNFVLAGTLAAALLYGLRASCSA